MLALCQIEITIIIETTIIMTITTKEITKTIITEIIIMITEITTVNSIFILYTESKNNNAIFYCVVVFCFTASIVESKFHQYALEILKRLKFHYKSAQTYIKAP